MPTTLTRGRPAAALTTVALTLALICGAVQPSAAQTPQSQTSQPSPAQPLPATLKVGALSIGGAFTREPPKGARVAGGYLTITNSGTAPDRLIGGSATFAKRFELHEMSMDGGMMKMRELPRGLEIKPGETVELKPGGYHVMFMDVVDAPTPGKTVRARLRFEKAGEVEVEFAVQPIAAGGASGAAKTKHHH